MSISNYKNIKLNLDYQSLAAKYAVMTASTINLGDDIQTLAAIHFLKRKGITNYIFIDREKLSDYAGQNVTLVMNGWFMHNLSKFPPSENITPIFISVHINDEKLIKKNVLYFQKYQPIGCRDESTVKLFLKYKIDAYFTGCLTLYFDEFDEKGQDKYLVDLNHYNVEGNFKKITHMEHKKNILNDIQSRLEAAENLLNIYRRADLVITSRLHCILPCRAFNTKAIFIFPKYKIDPRFKGLEEIIDGDVRPHDRSNVNRELIYKIKEKFDEILLT